MPVDGRAPPNPPALLTDLYQLTMLQAYFSEGTTEAAVFDLFVRRLPEKRNYLVVCGIESVLDYLENIRFEADDIEYLARLGPFTPDFLDHLSSFRFGGDVYAMHEGTVFFADEPVVEVIAPLPQAQLVEKYLLNQITFQSVAATKASRVVTAARGRPVVDFGLRRMHGADAGIDAARSFYMAGVDATSNVLAGRIHGIPVSGTMAHSYIEAHGNELEAFRSFARSYADTVLLVDTYDTAGGIANVIRLADELGPDFKVRGVRLDSGYLASLAVSAREQLRGVAKTVFALEDQKYSAGGGRGELDFGDGPRPYTFQRQDEASIGGSFQPALKAKYPLMSRLLALRARGRACAFTALETG